MKEVVPSTAILGGINMFFSMSNEGVNGWQTAEYVEEGTFS